jgi:hypothetical protein
MWNFLEEIFSFFLNLSLRRRRPGMSGSYLVTMRKRKAKPPEVDRRKEIREFRIGEIVLSL